MDIDLYKFKKYRYKLLGLKGGRLFLDKVNMFGGSIREQKKLYKKTYIKMKYGGAAFAEEEIKDEATKEEIKGDCKQICETSLEKKTRREIMKEQRRQAKLKFERDVKSGDYFCQNIDSKVGLCSKCDEAKNCQATKKGICINGTCYCLSNDEISSIDSNYSGIKIDQCNKTIFKIHFNDKNNNDISKNFVSDDDSDDDAADNALLAFIHEIEQNIIKKYHYIKKRDMRLGFGYNVWFFEIEVLDYYLEEGSGEVISLDSLINIIKNSTIPKNITVEFKKVKK